jgi:hypothetical protein
MTYKMFLDDERFPPNDGTDWIIIRNSADAIRYVKHQGIPYFISFDHDLGGDDTSRVFINWLGDYMLHNDLTFQGLDFDFYVHSQNPIGAEWIRGTMTSMMGCI